MEFGKGIVIFASGLLVGGLATLWYAEKKHEKDLDEELDRAYNLYNKKLKQLQEVPEEEKPKEEPKKEEAVKISSDSVLTENKELTQEKIDYAKIVAKALNSTDISEKLTPDVEYSDPYEITEIEFGDLSNYKRETLRYYKDHVLVDDDDHVIENPRGLIGGENLGKLRKWAADPNMDHDALYLQDDRLRIYYEILMDYDSHRRLYNQ